MLSSSDPRHDLRHAEIHKDGEEADGAQRSNIIPIKSPSAQRSLSRLRMAPTIATRRIVRPKTANKRWRVVITRRSVCYTSRGKLAPNFKDGDSSGGKRQRHSCNFGGNTCAITGRQALGCYIFSALASALRP